MMEEMWLESYSSHISMLETQIMNTFSSVLQLPPTVFNAAVKGHFSKSILVLPKVTKW